jgi:SAM-dependent methyltransferase
MTKLMNCNAIAPFYQTLEYASFGKYLEKVRFAFLNETAEAQTALICGGGDGRFLARLLHSNPRVHADFVDASSRMVELAQRRVAAMGKNLRHRVRFHSGDFRLFQPPRTSYDLIVTNFFLDCFPEAQMASVASRIAGWAAPGALWMLSDFAEAPGFVGGLWTQAVIGALYAAFRITTGLPVMRLPAYLPAVAAADFRPLRRLDVLGGLLHASIWRRASPVGVPFAGASLRLAK